VQEYAGTLTGSTFSGEFHQDAPGVEPQRYSGSISGTVEDGCHLVLTSVVQNGQETLTHVPFTKTACETEKPFRIRFSFRARGGHGRLVLEAPSKVTLKGVCGGIAWRGSAATVSVSGS